MTEKVKISNRIPHETLAENDVVSSWSLPSVDNKSRVVMSAKREKKGRNTDNEVIEDYSGKAKPKPLTADELRKLAEEAKREGFEQGYKEGLDKGLQEGTNKGLKEGQSKAYNETKQMLHEEIHSLKTIASHLFDPMQNQQDYMENIVVDMAIHFAQNLIEKEIRHSPQALITIVKKALEALPAGAKNISVYTNQHDAALIQKHLPKESRSWLLKADDSISPGGCRVETLESLVDFTVESRLSAFLKQVQEQGNVDASEVPPVNEYSEKVSDTAAADRKDGAMVQTEPSVDTSSPSDKDMP